MKILAVEFSSDQRSVALLQQEAAEGALQCSEVIETAGRSTNALALTEAALRQAHLEREQVQCLAVGLGPGSYTGIRAAIALAQGWQLAGEVKLLGLSTADCLAAQAQAEGLTGRVAVVVDGQRQEFYLAVYELGREQPRLLEPLRLTDAAAVQACLQAGCTLVGPEVTKWFPAGRVLFPRAAMLGRLALQRSDFIPGEQLEPIYLRQTTFVKAPPARVYSV